jgi:lipid A ethanolaminephosphotransferase
MVAWLSESMYARLGLDHACLVAHQRDPLSHDNLFHSVLGLAMVETNVYDPARDLFRSCRA